VSLGRSAGRGRLRDRRFDDLRRYAAMRLVRAGVATSESMALLGHETESNIPPLRPEWHSGAEAAFRKTRTKTRTEAKPASASAPNADLKWCPGARF